MAGTTASEINDLFLMRISDYRLDEIFTTSGSAAFTLYLEPWLLSSIVEFEPICNQSLAYTISGATEGQFTETLTLENKVMLSKLMTLYWLEQQVKMVLQFGLFLSDHDYKTASAAQNLSAKKSLYNETREDVNQSMIQYEYRYNDWQNWILQNYASGSAS
jgi:hypothetical protein